MQIPFLHTTNFSKSEKNLTSTIYNAKLVSKSTYYINTIKTNYGEFNNCFAAVKLWNHFESYKHLPLKMFKKMLSWTSWSLTVHEFSTGIYLLIYFIYLLFFFWLIIALLKLECPSTSYITTLFSFTHLD